MAELAALSLDGKLYCCCNFQNKIQKNGQEGHPLAHPGDYYGTNQRWLRYVRPGFVCCVLNSTVASEDLQGGGLFWHAARHDKTLIVWMIRARGASPRFLSLKYGFWQLAPGGDVFFALQKK